MIYFVEGSLASGKTTAAENLLRQCAERRERAVLYHEHTRENPLDFTARVFMSEEDYHVFEARIKAAYKAHYQKDYTYGLQKLKDGVETFCGGRILHIPTLICNDTCANRQLQVLEKFQLCNGVLPAAQYMSLLMARWKKFAGELDPSMTYIFEGALLQNPFLDLIGWYQLSDAELTDFYRDLLSPFDFQNISVLFITVKNREEALEKAGRERRHSEPPWIENLIKWVESSPFGRHQQLTGFRGAADFCAVLEARELTLLNSCGIPYRILERK